MRISVDGRWYDLTKWADEHPGGRHIIELFSGKDASDAFHSLHSIEAHKRLERMHSVEVKPSEAVAKKKPTELALKFRKFRQELEQQGFWKRYVEHSPFLECSAKHSSNVF
jgi:cytochrome b involved in lipid metabolism